MADSQKKSDADKVADGDVSVDAQFSTYKENTDLPETNPPAGRHVIQELGAPKESK